MNLKRGEFFTEHEANVSPKRASSWICEATNWEHQLVPAEVRAAADKAAQAKKASLDDGDDDMET